MHDLVENFAGIGAREGHLRGAWRNAYPFIIERATIYRWGMARAARV